MTTDTTRAELIEAMDRAWMRAVDTECGDADPEAVTAAQQALIDAEEAFDAYVEETEATR